MKIKTNVLNYKDPDTGKYTPIPVIVSAEDISDKQDKTDNALNTTSKEIVGAINELTEEIVNEATTRKNAVNTLDARMNALTSLGEGSTTGDAELVDARIDRNGKTWSNVGSHIRGITNKLVEAGFDEVIVGSENYNLFKPSECTLMYRLQDDTVELKSSNAFNAVSGWIPVEYGKYYTLSRKVGDGRSTTVSTGTTIMPRLNVKKADGTVLFGQRDVLSSISSSLSTIYIKSQDIVAVQFQINCSGDINISTVANLEAQEVMFVEGNSHDEAYNNSLNLPYMSGDAEALVEVEYTLKHDDTKANVEYVEKIESDVSSLKRNIARPITSGKYNDNLIFNDRFIRGISNLRDTEKAKEHQITITNNSGQTIKNASIVVGLHNTVGINPSNNNLPFQIYDEVFNEQVGFKFYDGNTELPYYIESESDCNYIIDKNIKTDQKTMVVFSDGKIAVYNGTVNRMQISSNDGATWSNICNEITSLPYRILLTDSQDNLFVASNDGKKLYKYTSNDGYMGGKVVIDLTDTDTQIGSILAEDSDGNLYLGTYQSVYHSVVRKSTNHGDTWTIVFDSTDNQHIHNIYVNKKVTPNEIFIGLDGTATKIRTYVSTNAGASWIEVDVPYENRDYAFRYAGENFYIGCGERNVLGGATLYKTTDYNNPNAYYPLFDNGQGIRDITNVIENSDDVLIAGGCIGSPTMTEQLFLSEDRGETWKTILMRPHHEQKYIAGIGLRTFSKKGNQIISETSTGYAMRFVYGNGAKTILAVVNVGDIPTSGKTITLKTGYVANVEDMEKVLTSYENIDGKVADIQICDGYVVDKVSNKRVLTNDTEICNHNIRLGQTSEYKILDDKAYRLKGSVNLGKLNRLNFSKGFTISMLFRKEKSIDEYLDDRNYHVIFQSGNTKLCIYRRSLVLMSGDTEIFGQKLYIKDAYINSVNDDYVRVTVYVTNDSLPSARSYTDNDWITEDATCTTYPITQNLSANDFIVGSEDMPNIARIEIYNRVLTFGEIMSLTNGCNLITDGSKYN